MSTPVTFQVGTLPVGFCWTNPQDYANALFGFGGIISGSVAGGGVQILVQANAPGPSFQGNTLWGKLVNGYLEGTYWYLGGWYRTHPVPPSTASRIIWTGSESSLWAYDGGDGTNPAAFPPTPTTGAMWVRDTVFGDETGSNGFKIPVGIGINATAYDGGSATQIIAGGTGGEERHSLIANEMPPHAHNEVLADGVTGIYPMNAQNPGQDQVTFPGARTGAQNKTDITGGAGSPAVVRSHQNMPPFLGVIFAKRSSRIYIAG